MSDRDPNTAQRKVAVIGSGIAGLSAAYDLAKDHQVTLFEAERRLGGHARTLWAGKRGDQPVDTGFIVFNQPNYPHLTKLFTKLDVPVTAADMSFSVSLDDGAFEYAFKKHGALQGIFAQPANALNPRFLQMLCDVLRFNKSALEASRDKSLTLEELLQSMGMGPWIKDRFLVPFTGAIWSIPTKEASEFPADVLVQFLDNHGLLTHKAHPQWFSVAGGSAVYVEKLYKVLRKRGTNVRLGCQVSAVARENGGVALKVGGGWHGFDSVVLAIHADHSLRLLTDASKQEKQSLGAIRFQPNTIVLHADPHSMPRRQACWAAWNHIGTMRRSDKPPSITYWMNALQVSIPSDDPLFVTLNPARPIDEAVVYDQSVFRHPIYDHQSVQARAVIRASNGTRNTWFCGAWMRNGFHEDGIASGYEAAQGIRKRLIGGDRPV